MRLLFLDIDGVVNCATTTQRHRGVIGIDPWMAFLVGKIALNVPGLKMVLTSSWRHLEEGRAEVERQVLPIYDSTPYPWTVEGRNGQKRTSTRGEEIDAWLRKHPGHHRIAILDDEPDMLHQHKRHFFKTEFSTGITEEIAEAVTKHFLEGPSFYQPTEDELAETPVMTHTTFRPGRMFLTADEMVDTTVTSVGAGLLIERLRDFDPATPTDAAPEGPYPLDEQTL